MLSSCFAVTTTCKHVVRVELSLEMGWKLDGKWSRWAETFKIMDICTVRK